MIRPRRCWRRCILCYGGIPFIYQGQEIGMENVEFTSMDQVDDVIDPAMNIR